MRQQNLYFLVIISQIMNIIFASLPISKWNDLYVGGKTQPYNLIDTDPSCYWQGFCPMFPPGGELSAFPNGEEKFQQMLHNIHRMFTNCSRDTAIGKWKFNALDAGGLTEFCETCKYCGNTKTISDRRPLYWYSDANAAARFKQWDEKHCNQSWYSEPDQTAHSTCKWGLDVVAMWGSGIHSETPIDRCPLFSLIDASNACQFAPRATTFCSDDKDRCWFETEGICGGNSCLWDGHCDPIFAATYDYVGKGFVEGTNGVDAVYSRFTKEIYYLLPVGAHFDARITTSSQDWRNDEKYFNLMVEYYDANYTQTVSACYALYAGHITTMEVFISGTMANQCHSQYYKSGEYSAVFYAYYTPHVSCEPYSFICKTSQNRFVRLPEQNDYYFGTDLIDWVWSSYSELGYDECKEQHYYNHPLEGWTANGGETLAKSDIYHYHNGASCIGCAKITILQCLEDCIYNYDVTQLLQSCIAACNEGATPSPIPNPTPPPTASPITYRPTASPITPRPTTSPITPPSASPITYRPTASPTQTTQSGETCSEVISWFYKWTRIGVWDENEYGALYRSVAEEAFIADHAECGHYDGDLEYYYYFYWGGLQKPNKRQLWIYMIICCGEGKTFGPDYEISDSVPNKDEYAANGILKNKYGESQYVNEDSWTDPSTFGIKQYIVFSIIGLLLICCCVGSLFIFKRRYQSQKETTAISPRSNYKYQMKYASKSRGSKKRLPQMQGLALANFPLPGPKHVEIASHGQDSTNASSDGNNTYQQQHESTDCSQGDADVTTHLGPIQLMGHQIMASTSFDTPEMDAVVQHLNLGLPKPHKSDDIQMHTLDAEDIANAFDMDI